MKSANITKLIFVPTGHYHDMALRPYTTHVSGDSLNRIHRATDEFRDISSSALSGIAGQILRPTTQSVGSLSIANGWNQQRYMFMMEVTSTNDSMYPDENDSARVQYVSGYTDYCDPSFSGYVDPQMNMYLSTVINTREFMDGGGRINRRSASASRYLQQNAGQGTIGRGDHYFAMRPRDVCVSVGNNGMMEYVDSDYRTSMSSRGMMSVVSNDLPTDYLSRTFQAYRYAVNKSDSQADDIPTLMSNAANATGDDKAIDDPFIMNLYRETMLAEGSCFSYGELCSLYPYLDNNVASIIPPMDVARDIGFEAHQANDSQHWGGSDNETVIATIASSAIPALMATAMLTQVAFYITNDTITGQPTMEWLSRPASFMLGSQDLTNMGIYFQDRMTLELFRDITNNGNITVSIRVHCDLVTSDMRLDIEVDGGVVTPYCVPTFASGLITPVIANDRGQLDSLATGIHSIFEAMGPSSYLTPTADDYSNGFALNNDSLSAALGTRTSSAASSRPSTGTGWKV
jgi:hypothetical protein